MLNYGAVDNNLSFLHGESAESLVSKGCPYHSHFSKRISKSCDRNLKRKRSVLHADIQPPLERAFTRSAASLFDKLCHSSRRLSWNITSSTYYNFVMRFRLHSEKRLRSSCAASDTWRSCRWSELSLFYTVYKRIEAKIYQK